MSRKSPHQHHVKSHIKNGTRVQSYERGKGKPKIRTVRDTHRVKTHTNTMEKNAIKRFHDQRKAMLTLFKSKDYEAFIEQLGDIASDSKVKAVLIGGLYDGQIKDDKLGIKDIITPISSLKPTQREIDLEASLKWIGKNPGNVKDFLDNKTIGPEYFGGNEIVSANGKNIIDGHHRWSQVYFINPDAKLETVDLPILNPIKALKNSQIAIAGMSGKLLIKKVDARKNIFTMSLSKIKSDIPKYLTAPFYNEFYKHDPNKFKDQNSVNDYVYKNIIRLRKENKPVTQIHRGNMPQYDSVGVKPIEKAFEKGTININYPYIKSEAGRKR